MTTFPSVSRSALPSSPRFAYLPQTKMSNLTSSTVITLPVDVVSLKGWPLALSR